MQFAIDLIQKIPAGWPRLAMLAAIIVAYFFFPDIFKKLTGGRKEKERLEEVMRFLQMKKLLLEIEALQKEKNLSGFEFPGEARLLAELKESATTHEKSKERTPYLSRLKHSLLGAVVFFLLTVLLWTFGHYRETTDLGRVKFLLQDLGFSAGCGLLASFIPLGTTRTSFLYGLTMPFALALLVLTVTH
jgi:uncharacterized membrane protein